MMGQARDFLWGVAISSHQNDGGADAADWTVAERAGRLPVASGRGADFRAHWREDLDRVRHELGANAIRFSVEWARVEPEPGRFDQAELRWLEQLFEGARDRGLAVICTLHHFTSPQWIYEGLWPNGWESAATAGKFERYVREVVRHFGPAVRYWLTFNEPTNVLVGGHLAGRIPPFRVGPISVAMAARTMVEAHERAYDVIHEAHPDAMVSISEFTGVLGIGPGVDYLPGRLLDVIRTREAPSGGRPRYRHLDFVGMHYYGQIPPLELNTFPLRFDRFGVRPEAFGRLMRDAYARYGLPILIGENGLATYNHQPRPDGWTADRYMAAHLAELRATAAAGVPLLGYCWWTLTDNYEWGSFDSRFGLYRVDIPEGDYTRHPTPAVEAYRRLTADPIHLA